MQDKSTKIETVIVGGGIAGLGCARTLSDAGYNSFQLVSDTLGGRIKKSADGKVNYGAWYVRDDYKRILPHVKLGKRAHRLGFIFHKKATSYTIVNWRLITHPLEAWRFYRELKRFHRAYVAYKDRSETLSQKEVIEKDNFLYKLYHQPVDDFIAEQRIENLARDYLYEVAHATSFGNVSEMSAMVLLYTLLPFITKTYQFDFDLDSFTKNFQDRLVEDTVTAISKTSAGYNVTLSSGNQINCKNLIVATPAPISQKLLTLPKINKSTSTWVLHIEGEIKRSFRPGVGQLFSPHSDIYCISDEINNTYLVYSKTERPNLNQYFNSYEYIARQYWETALVAIGDTLLEARVDENCYVIGDHNVGGLDDSYVTGIYAANQILKS